MSNRKPLLVLVVWVDSFGCASAWEPIKDSFEGPEVLVCRSVGWLIHEDDQCLVVVPHIVEASDRTERQGCGDMTIPACAVKSVSYLTSQETPT